MPVDKAWGVAGPAAMPAPLEVVHLLREDVPARFIGAPADADDAQRFLLWWVLAGRHEYPAAGAVPLTEAQRRWLFEPVPDASQRGGLGVNRLLQCLHANRPDLRRAFDLRSPVGQWDALAWLYVTGRQEVGLDAFLDGQTRAALESPAFSGPGPQPTWLALFVWRLHAPLQKAFDLAMPAGRAGLALWFERDGAPRFGLREPQALPVAGAGEGDAIDGRAVPFGVNLIGFAFGELGIGEDLRMAAHACEAAGIPFKVLNVNPGAHLRQADRIVAPHVVEHAQDLPYAINLFCLTGFDTLRVYAEQGPALFAGRCNIGWWPWELPVWPRRWALAFSVVDQVWAATSFTQKMFKAATDRPVTLMPLAVSVQRMRRTSRRALGLPARRFLFLYIFDFNSYLARKNPHAVIDAFQRAFPPGSDRSVGLVLKTMNSRGDNPAWAEFVQRCDADARIVLLQQTLDREVVLGLVDACDAYVSLHRSEGFGRTMAEAMLLGKPVVGTGFSGNADFLNRDTGYPVKWSRRTVDVGDYPFVGVDDKPWWAEPDLAHAATQMQAARDAAGSPWAQQLPQQVNDLFDPAVIGARMAESLFACYKDFLKKQV